MDSIIFRDVWSREKCESYKKQREALEVLNTTKREILYYGKKHHVNEKLETWISELIFERHIKSILVSFEHEESGEFSIRMYHILCSKTKVIKANPPLIEFKINNEKYVICFISAAFGSMQFRIRGLGSFEYLFCVLDETKKTIHFAETFYNVFVPMLQLDNTKIVFYCKGTGKKEEIITGDDAIRNIQQILMK